jgi:hypothetical protein
MNDGEANSEEMKAEAMTTVMCLSGWRRRTSVMRRVWSDIQKTEEERENDDIWENEENIF